MPLQSISAPHGIAAEGPVTRDYGMRQLTVDDPDGYMVLLPDAGPLKR